MKKFEIEIEEVKGYCVYKYEKGDKFIWEGYSTPNGFCGGAYVTLFPILLALNSGARFEFEDNPFCKTKMACPDNGNIIFKIKLLKE